jgi:amidohydrolase
MKGAIGIRAAMCAVLLSSLPGLPAARAQSTVPLQAEVDGRLFETRNELIEVRRDIHRHPEVSGREKRTAGVIAARLRALDLEVRTGVGGHGVVALLRGALPGPTVAFRADMDAVASRDPDPVEFASTVEGVRHICGHDIHTTVGLALAEGMAAIQVELAGSVMFIFQPAEENATGARAMLEDGAFDEFGAPDAIFAYHTAPLEVGQVGTKAGVLLAGRDRITVTLSGRSDLSDPAEDAVRLIRETSTIDPSTPSAPGDFAVTNVFRSQAGTEDGTWVIRAQSTTSSLDASDRVERSIRDGLTDLERDGASWSLEYEQRWIAGAANDPALEAASLAPLRSILGEDGVVVIESVPTQFSEDFGSFQEQVPGVMYYLGVSNSEKGWVGLPHSPGYVADEESIEVGARAMAAVMLDFLYSSPGTRQPGQP